MTRTDDRASAVLPVAAALVCAVNDRDADQVAEILNAPDLDWRALAVVLAASVDPDRPLSADEPEPEPVDEPAELRWVTRGLIKVAIDPASLVACPTCRARIDEPCRTSSGATATNYHKARLTSRRCPCGNALPKRDGQRANAVKFCSAACRDTARRRPRRNAA